MDTIIESLAEHKAAVSFAVKFCLRFSKELTWIDIELINYDGSAAPRIALCAICLRVVTNKKNSGF